VKQPKENPPIARREMPGEEKLIYEDRWMVVFDKPSGLLSQPGRGADKQDCLVRRVVRQWPAARIVHRLDRDTSGLIVLALDAQTHRELSGLFAARAVQKTYIARVAGHPQHAAGTIDAPICKDTDRPPRYRIDRKQGRTARTHWQRMRMTGTGTDMELWPITGRSHQLRVHLEHIGHPILGDPLYGSAASQTAGERLHLHATRLELSHPVTAERVAWNSPCPF